jgi:putative sigma-54 modulation protein
MEEGQDRFEEHAGPRLESLTRVYEKIEGIRITVSAQRNWRTVDVTVQLHGALLRAEERSDDVILALDRAVSRMERQLARIKDRQNGFGHESLRTLATGSGGPELLEEPAALVEEVAEEEPEGIRIVRTKSVEVKPMAPEEAALQMELLGHDFFVFMDAETEQVGVVYRRKAGGYGLIEPETRGL